MSWNYRILHHEHPGCVGWYGLYHVYYAEDGTPESCSAEPIDFTAWENEGPAGIVASLERALRDARERPVLEYDEIDGAGGQGPEKA